MRHISIIFTALSFSFLINQSFAQCNTNILSNAGFDTPVQPSIGNNLTGVFTFSGWTMTGGPFNVIKTDGSSYSGGPDNAKDGNQYIDITSAAGTIYQDFTITGSTKPVGFSGYFSSREQSGYVDWVGSIQIINLATSAVVSTSNSRIFTTADGAVPAQETWYYLYGNTTLAPGNYRYLVNLGNHGNFDAAFVATNCVLSVRLQSFTGSVVNDKVQLGWQAQSETNFSHYEVERSIDGRNFTTIGTVASVPDGLYSFADNSIAGASKFYYRIKMVDKDGKFSYSAIISITTKGNINVSLAPNPAKNYLNVNGLKSKGEIKIYDITGRVVKTEKNITAQAISIDIAALNNGTYILQYFDGASTTTQKFNKQ
jgi:Secretion system C-terminal sorting domain